MIELLLAALESDPLERLRWIILRSFGLMPGSSDAMKISDADIVRAGLNLVLDLRNAVKLDSADSYTADINDSFDSARYELLANGDLHHE